MWRMVKLARDGLPLMFRPDVRQFAFTRRRFAEGRISVVGTSLRYGAIAVLGAVRLPIEAQLRLFGGETAAEFCCRLIAMLHRTSNLGDLSLVAWAAAELKLPDARKVIDILRAQEASTCACYTVEAAWVLSALVAAVEQCELDNDIVQARDRLLGSFSRTSGLFPHWTHIRLAPWFRSHVACFADQVYPIQALSRYHKLFGHDVSLEVAALCSERICHLQGDAGQWWWHYDVRNGSVIEEYPVYSVHQDAMAPMALFDLYDAGGPDHAEAMRRALKWMVLAPEVGCSLIDDDYALIWRKVARAEPGKLVRTLRAATSRVHPGVRLNWLDALFKPTFIDYESRPYHLGWLLYAWLGDCDEDT